MPRSRPLTGTTAAGTDAIARETQLLEEMTGSRRRTGAYPMPVSESWWSGFGKISARDSLRSGRPQAGPPAQWNETRVLIFTEYDDTKRYLQQQLSAAIATTDRADERIAVYHGPTPPAEREEIKRAFTTDPKKHPLRILIATDAAREGLNLQTHCWNLFHFDVPWNPSRMEQRNGRIDRKLQPNPEVFCHYFVYTDREEDRILEVLVSKTETHQARARQSLPGARRSPGATLRQGIRHRDIVALRRSSKGRTRTPRTEQVVEEELEESRERQEDLKAQIQRLQNRLKASQDWLSLREDHFRSAISCALQMMHADPLKPLAHGARLGHTRSIVSSFPRSTNDREPIPTWAETMDTLRAPRKRDQKPWEWRRESPIRPVVFHDTGTMDQDVVHLHLEHRVVQRLLGRFTAQGFVHHDLSRACLSQTNDAIPRVILMGRLCLYGPRAARLHEELVPVTARWIELTQRKQRLEPLRPGGRVEDPRPARNRPAADGAPTSIRSSRKSSGAPRRRDIRSSCLTWRSAARSSPRKPASPWPSGRIRKPTP